MRRRQRRLRSWWRHEQQSVAAALAAAHRHSCDRKGKTKVVECEGREEAGSETYHVPRRPKTLLPGTRPAPPSEVPGPLGPAVTVGYVAAGAPLFAVSSLRGADGVDDTAVKFLLRAEHKKKEDEEERKQELEDKVLDDKLEAEFGALTAIGHLTTGSPSLRGVAGAGETDREEEEEEARKAKKRSKRNSGCTRRRRRQWHDRCAGFAGCGAPRDVSPFGRRMAPDARHHGRYGQEGQYYRPGHGSGMCMAGTAGNALRVVLPTVVVRPRCSAS